MSKEKIYKTFNQFYPYYLTEHSDTLNRTLHFCGTSLLLISLCIGIFTQSWIWFALIPVLGYGFAWVGHFFIEKNKPATFTYPLYSLAGDFVMFWQLLTNKIKF
jgi:hypothetical protein